MKYTTDDFKEYIKNNPKGDGKDYEVLGDYVDSKTKILIRHISCGTEYLVRPSYFKSGTRCPNCYGTPKKTTEQFKKEVYNLVGNEYSVVGEYKTALTKIRMRHNCNKCNNFEYDVKPNSFLGGRRCPKCFGNERKTTEQFKQEIFSLVENEYEILSEYKSTHKKILMKHSICNTKFETTPHKFLQGHRCPECFGNKRKDTTKFNQEVFDIVGKEYEVLEEYVNSTTPINMHHTICGNIFPVRPNSFLRGSRCPFCAGNIKKTTKQYKKEVLDNPLGDGDEYIILGEYIDAHTKIEMVHNICNNHIFIRPHDFKKGVRCNCQNISKGEKIIKKYLDDKNILYKTQYTFKDCKFKRQLPFDFAIFYPNGELALLVEFQGNQHYYDVEIFEEDWVDVFHRDMIKRKYCFDKGIPLLTFTFWELDKNILEQELEQTFKPLMEFLV